jgi:two-component system response regulator NreC
MQAVGVTILLADDHQVVRQGLRALLQAEADFTVLGETGDGLQVPVLAERLQPQVLILDLKMPGLNGLEAARQVAQRAPDTRIVMLTMHHDDAYVLEAVRSGVAGYIHKESHVSVLIQAIRAVAGGQRFLSPHLSEATLKNYLREVETAPLDPFDTLTAREREVLSLVAESHTSAEIGKRLFISSRTVETHRANLMRKLGLETQTDLIRYALRKKIIILE